MKVFAKLVIVLVCLLFATPSWALRIGVVVPDSQSMFWVTYLSFIERGAEDLGIDLEERDARSESLGMIGHTQALIDMGVDGLIVTAGYGVGAEMIKRANDAGIPVVATLEPVGGVEPGRQPYYLAWVGPDWEDAAARAADAALDSAPRTADGRVQLLAVEPDKDSMGRIERLQGLRRAVDGYPNAELVCVCSARELPARLPEIFKKWPGLGAIWGGDAKGARMAVESLVSLGVNPGRKVAVTAMGLAPGNVFGLRNGEITFDIGGEWMAGGYALVLLHDFLRYGSIVSDQSRPFTLLPVDRDTLSAYENYYPQGLPSYDFKSRSRAHQNGERVVQDLILEY